MFPIRYKALFLHLLLWIFLVIKRWLRCGMYSRFVKLTSLLFGVLLGINAQAGYQRSYTNLGFETPSIATTAPCRVYISNTKVPGWLTTHPFFNEEAVGSCTPGVINTSVRGQILEIWYGPRDMGSGFGNLSAREGLQFAELNAESVTEMSQNVCLVNGEPVSWRLSHNGRNATPDTMNFRAGTQAIASISTTTTGVGTVTTCASGTCAVNSQVTNVSGNGPRWADYSGTFTYTGASGQTVLGFQSTSGSATLGNFLDAIQITVKPIIEFTSANYTIPENSLSPPPIQVVVAGIVPVGGIVLTFNVTGGTAILGSDYTVNGGSATTFNVTLPAGDYGQGTPLIVNVPVSIIDDTTNEPDENFTVTIAPDVNKFHLMSTSVCGASGNGTATYTIIDDDAPQDFDVSVVKSQRAGTSGTFLTNPLTVTGGTVQYQLIMTNKGAKTISAGAPATFSDVVPANVGLVATNFSFTGGGGSTSCTASRTGNTVTGSFSGPTGATCTVIMQGTASTTGTITNTATTAVPVGNNDIFPSDNSSSVVTTIARASLILNKISNGAVGTFGFTLTNTTQNSGNTITTTFPGTLTQVDGNTSTGGIQPFIISAAGDITINESTIPSGWALASAACTNAAGASVGSLSGTTYTIPSASNVSGEVFSCNFLNNRPPTIKVEKISYGGAAGFTFADTNLTGSIGTLTTSTSGVGVTSALLPVTTTTTDVTITETLVAGYTLTSASCIDENSALTGKVGTFGTLVGNVLTIPFVNFVTGADIKCTFNNRRSTTLTLRKTWAAGSQAGHTATVTASGFINNATSGTSTATLAGNTTTGTAVTVYVGESGTIGEVFGGGAAAGDYNGVLACTGTNGSLAGNTLTITQSAGTALVCTYTNTKLPKITLTKISNGGVGAFSFTGDNGFTNQTITTVTSGVGVLGTTQTLAAASQSTTITETIPAGYLVTAINCTGLGAGGSATPNLAAGSVVLNAAATAAGSNIACTFTNTKQPLIRVHKTVSSLVDANDRFTTEIRTGGVGGTVVSNTTASTTLGGGVLTTGGVATYSATGSYQGLIGTPYFITEALSGGTSVLGQYTTSISCTNAYAGNPTATVLPSGTTTPFTITPQQGDDISCTLTNSLKQPTVTISKISNGSVGTFNFTNTNLSPTPSSLTTVTQGVAVSTAPILVTTRNQLVTIAETVPANWTLSSASCTDANSAITGNTGSFGTLVGNTLTIPAVNVVIAADITCTFTNRKSANITLRKTWTNAIVNDAVSISATGLTSLSAVADTANETDIGSVQTVFAGDNITLAESFTTGNSTNYNSSLSCIGNTTPLSGSVLTVNAADSNIVCTYTNSRKSATFRLAKAWGANSIAGNVANISATTGLTNNTTAFTSTASTNTTGSSVTVYVGETVTFPAETMSTGTLSNYNTVLSCSANGGATANSLSGTNGQSSNTLTVGAGDEGKTITCTYTNTRISQSLSLAKQWTNAANGHTASVSTTGGTNNATVNSTSTGNNLTTGTAVTVYAGDVVTLPAESFGGGASASDYNTILECTGGSTLTSGAVGRSVTISNSATATTCTYTNSRKSATFRLAKVWGANSIAGNVANIGATTGLTNNTTAFTSTASTNTNGTAVTVYAGETATLPAETFSSGTLANYTTTLSCDNGITPSGTNGQNSNTVTIPNTVSGLVTCTYTNTRIAQNLTLAKQWANATTGHTAIVTTTGGTNNATVNSTSTGNNLTTGTGVTVYAGDVVTLPAETFGGGASASDYNTNLACTGGSTLASGAVGRSITISNSTIATTCTYTNAKLPNITITKISNGGVGSFDFTGTNGFSNQTITTVSSGVGVAGATQRLTTAGVATQITETVPYGFALTNVSCTGLGTGTATVNYNTATVTLDANATAGPNNIACTFTNTAYGTTPTDPLLKTTRFSAVPDVPTIVRGFSGTQTIVMTNHGPDDATNVVVYYRPLLATGVSVTSVSSPAGTCTFSSPDWVCPAIASVLNGASFNITVTYSTTNASSLGIAQQGEVRVNSNEYTECGGVSEYKYNVWGQGGTSQPQPAPTNSAFWVGNTNTTTTATPSGAYSTESTDIFQAWPINQDSPTGAYLYSPVAGQHNNIYSPSSTNATPTVSKVLTGLNGQPENNVLLPQFGSTGTFTGDNKRAWEGQTCIYVPVATTVTPCLTMFDDAAYISVKNLNTGVTTVAAGQSSWNPGSVLSGSVPVSPGYYVIKARISNRNTNGGNSEDAQGGYGQLAGIGSATCSTADLDALAQNAVPEKINIVEPVTVTLTKISQGGTGTFNFTGDSGFGTQSITTVTSGVGVTAASKTLSAVGVATTITETIPSGYVVSNISCSGLGAGGTATPNLVTGSVLLDSAATAAGANINCTFTNVGAAFTITGQVFLDNGKNAAIPHNGILEADELGIGNITVNLTDCASTIYQSTVTDGAGAYSLGIPNSIVAGSSLCVVEQPSSNLISVSGAAGSTGGSYSLAQDRTQFILSAATNYTGVNFGNVVQSQLTGTGNQTIAAGTTASYGHQFIAGTEGTVTFSTAQAPTPNLTWTSLVYLDNNCNALLDAGDTQVTTPILVVADQVLCLVQKVQSPSTASNGAQDVSTLSASFVYAAPSVIVGNYSQNDTTIIMDTGLVLVKKVRQVLSCPSTVADTNVFVTNNQALPNTLIEYQIVYSNPSSNVVSNIVINDMTPSFTTFRSASCRTTPPSVLCSVSSSPTVGGVGAIQWNIANNPLGLGSGQSGDVRFCVRVDQ